MGTHELSRSLRALIAIAVLVTTAVRAEEPPAAAPEPVPPASQPESAPPVDAEHEAESGPTSPTPSGPPPDVPSEVPGAKKEINYSLVPIPEIIVDPNEGNTYG